MSEQDFNEIEQRLSAMRPAEPRHEVRQKIVDSLENNPVQAHRSLIFRRPLGIALAATAMIAFALVLLTFIVQFPLSPPVAGDRDPSIPGAEDEPATPDPPPNHELPLRPTLLVMHKALRQSPEALDELINRSGLLAMSEDLFIPQSAPTTADMWQWVHREELQ